MTVQVLEHTKTNYLREIIRSYKLNNPTASTASLAREINVPQSNLSKIENLQRKATLEETVKILAGTGNDQYIPSILNSIYENTSTRLVPVQVNSKAQEFIDKKMRETQEEILRELKKDAYKGDKVVFFDMYADNFLGFKK